MSDDVTAAVEAVLMDPLARVTGWTGRELVHVDAIRAALHDPDGALARVRAEAAEGALREAAHLFEGNQRRLARLHGGVHSWTEACDWLRERAQQVTDHG